MEGELVNFAAKMSIFLKVGICQVNITNSRKTGAFNHVKMDLLDSSYPACLDFALRYILCRDATQWARNTMKDAPPQHQPHCG